MTSRTNNIAVIGDIHGYWPPINEFINKKNPDIILQCGDFGYWPKFHNTRKIHNNEYETIEHNNRYAGICFERREKKWNQYGLKMQNTHMYFCPGNHEDWNSLLKLNEFERTIMPGVHYMERFSTLELPDGRIVMFIGGADSIDKGIRTIGIDWFPEEVITYKEMMYIPDIKVDIIISHTCPEEFMDSMKNRSKGIYSDPTRKALSQILEYYKPDLWYFAHFHKTYKGMYNNTRWYCLNMATETCWRRWLK